MEIVKNILRVLIPYTVRKRRFYKTKLNGCTREAVCKEAVNRISEANHATVLFIASTLPMWRYQEVVDILSADKRFDIKIIICPLRRYDAEEAKLRVEELKTFFNSKGLDVPSTLDTGFNLEKWFNDLNPNIIFYCQHYGNFYNNCLDYEKNNDRLWGYIPYGLITIKEDFVYNSEFHNLAWRVYEPTELHLRTARRIMANDAKNVRIVGEPHADEYFGKRGRDPWCKIGDGKPRKRVIWAPHFSIHEKWLLNRGSFLWLHEGMVELARKYADTVQFVFKPHPFLYVTLCNHKDWGKERTDAYYKLWSEMSNTQVETGEFIELFMHSDGMIHDCGSFTGEYMFTRKPVMFMSRDFNGVRKLADDFGLKCLDLHDVGTTLEDADHFIKEVILAVKDSKKLKRERFFEKHLLPPNGKSVAENVYDDLVKSLGLR